ncbi:bifunctional nuclease domain-containing protein, partial [Cellulomonas septica]
AGSSVAHVEITRLEEGVFHAELVLTTGPRVDSRASDAIALALLVAVALGHEVVAVDTRPEKLATARRLSAAFAVEPDDLAATGVRAPVVVEAAGSARAFETALAATAPGGTTVTVGLPAPEARASVSPLTLTAEARTVVGSYLGSSVPARDVPVYVDLWRAGRLPLEELVSSHIALTDLDLAMDRLAAGSELRQLITFDERTPT